MLLPHRTLLLTTQSSCQSLQLLPYATLVRHCMQLHDSPLLARLFVSN